MSPGPGVGSFAVNSAFNSAFSPGAQTRTPDPASVGLQTRVEEYWQARIQGNTQRTLQYEHPAQRDKLDEHAYRARTSRIDIRTFSIADPDSLQLPAEAQEASVPVRIQYQYVFPTPGCKTDAGADHDPRPLEKTARRLVPRPGRPRCSRIEKNALKGKSIETLGRGMEHTGNGPKRQKLMTAVLLDRLFQVRYQRGNLLQGGNERRWFRGPGEE